ncbi:hypothetical protein SDC9_103997 [bioreactor metagenome]|uniref:Uncharacterized protein n=1 Tax=bioreactor metagenome TaxID=1076179 RepID=A0A645AV94_9ZZZZ
MFDRAERRRHRHLRLVLPGLFECRRFDDNGRFLRSFAQTLDGLRQHVATGFDIFDKRRRCRAGTHGLLDAGLQHVRRFAQVHRAGHAGATLEGMQETGNRVGSGATGWLVTPGAQLCRQVTRQIDRLFKEGRQQLLVEFVGELRQRRNGGRNDLRLGLGLRFGSSQNADGAGKLNDFGTGRLGYFLHDRRRMENVVQRTDQLRLFNWRLLAGQPDKHILEGDDALAYGFQAFDTVRLRRPIATQQGVLQGDRQMMNRHQADRCRDPAQCVGRPRHLEGHGGTGIGLQYGIAVDQHLQMPARFLAEDVEQRRRGRDRERQFLDNFFDDLGRFERIHHRRLNQRQRLYNRLRNNRLGLFGQCRFIKECR